MVMRFDGPWADLHVSHAGTYLSLAAAMGGIAAAMAGRVDAAGGLVTLSIVADTFDGRVARLFARSARHERHGRQIDSLTDVVAFAVAPVVMLAAAIGGAPTAGWWAAAFVYVLATVTRLAHFNVAAEHAMFVGLPAPAAALLPVTAVAVGGGLMWPLVAGAVLMVAPLRFRRPGPVGLGGFAAWATLVGAWLVLH
jgi:phosphatidylserine synthase